MAEATRNGGELSAENGIPTGLNRIKTRRAPSKDSKPDDSGELTDYCSPGVSKPYVKQKQRAVGLGHPKNNGHKEGVRKGKKIARWLTSHLFKESNGAFDELPSDTRYCNHEIKGLGRQCYTKTKQQKGVKHASGEESSPETTRSGEVRKGLKSFSHELGPKGGIRPAHSRPHSYDDLKELLGSLRSRFDTAKEVVNTELAFFSSEVMEFLQKNDSLPHGQIMAEDLLILSQQCIEMNSLQFRAKCEMIVQDLTEKRKQCQIGLLKWLLTRMLFILTRCTRLLHFEKESEPIEEKSLHKLKKFLESIPSVEMNWVPNPGIVDSGAVLECKYGATKSGDDHHREATWCRSGELADECKTTSKKDFMVIEPESLSQGPQTHLLLNAQCYHQANDKFLGDSKNKFNCCSLREEEQSSSDSVICRICEEVVPTSHLESHSYICAYADKCDLKYSDVDERLLKLAEMLEQIIASRNLNIHALYDSSEISRPQILNSAVPSEVYSPKISEWRSKGVEGMFEDLHEMDTACIDDSHFSTTNNLRSHFVLKLSHCGPPSSTGSVSSASSTNTPKAGHFDFFWLEHNNPSELEDVRQMVTLVDIARCVAGTDISIEMSHEFLLACMEDLQNVLQHSKLKALVVDTFGGRIESLMREKYILACEMMDVEGLKSNGRSTESSKYLLDNASNSSTMSTPLHPLHKERTSIDDFEIIKPISRGAFGKVFLARKRTTGDLFAIKELKKLDIIWKNDIERILAERNILITVRNPFVVRFFYSFTSRDNLYLVMEYLNGGDLYSLLQKVGCLEEDIARIYIAELVLALEYLHSLGIVHRDLKPDNILIAHDGHIKLTDFGLSKIGLMNSTADLPGPETNEITLSSSHGLQSQQVEDESQRAAVGTPDYLAPEILLGTEHGYAADWWSVGIILFEFICGIPPFTADHPEIIFDNILNRKIPWPSIPTDMSYEAQDLIDRFLVHDPDQRLGSKGSSEVKAHPFFKGVNWDTVALQKAAFVPNPAGVDDTSYFVSRYGQFSTRMPDDQDCSDASDCSDSSSSVLEKMDECGDIGQFASSLDLSLMNFSFKNLSQLASINRDVLLQNWKEPPKCLSPDKDPDL